MADKNPPNEPYIKITNVRPETKAKIENIADWLGVSVSHLLKGHVIDLINKHPPEYQKPYNKD